MVTIAGLVSVAVLPLLAAAEVPLWEPPIIWAESSLPEPTGKRDFVQRLRIGALDVVLEETPLADVSRRLKAPVGHRGDAGDSVSWVCLLGEDQDGPWALWLESGEIHGRTVGAFLLKRRSSGERFDSRCVRLAAAVVISLPIRLGMSRAELVRTLGKPAARSGETVVYFGCQMVKVKPQGAQEAEDFDLCSSLYVRLRAGLVDAVEVWRTTTS